MKYFLSLFTLSMLLFCNSLSAQKKNCPGLYISQQGDTVKGVFPKYAQWTKNPSQVDFSNEGSVNLVQLTPQNTRYFLVEGNDEYLSYTGSRLLNPIEDAVLFNEKSVVDSEDSIQQVSTFLRLVKKTPGISLYILNDNKRVNFFYQLPGQPIIELRYKKAFNQNQIHEMAEYRQQLYNLFTDIITQQDLTSALEKLPYQERDIASFLETLLPGSKDERKKLNRRTDWVLSAGATLNMINVRAEEFYAAVPGTNTCSLSPLISAGFIIPIDRNFGRFFFYPQLKLFRYKNTSEENQSTYITSVTYQADLATVTELSGGVNLINQENCRLFLTAGFGMFAQMNAKQVKHLYGNNAGKVETKLPTLTYSIDASAGITLGKKILVSATYMVPTTINDFIFYSVKLSGIQLQIGYKL